MRSLTYRGRREMSSACESISKGEEMRRSKFAGPYGAYSVNAPSLSPNFFSMPDVRMNRPSTFLQKYILPAMKLRYVLPYGAYPSFASEYIPQSGPFGAKTLPKKSREHSLEMGSRSEFSVLERTSASSLKSAF